MHAAPLLVELPENTRGRDFVVGDLHGHVSLLEQALAARRFDPAGDRVIAVGDVIDRGPESLRALALFAEPWFYSVRGNHEQAMLDWIDALLDGRDPDEVRMLAHRHFSIGGDWAIGLLKRALNGDESVLHDWRNALSTLPWAIATHAHGVHAGIVHACVPGADWDFFRDPDADPHRLHLALWCRTPEEEMTDGVRGIDEVFVGHNVVQTPMHVGNAHLIETCAWQGGELTLVELGRGPGKAVKPSGWRGWLRRGTP